MLGILLCFYYKLVNDMYLGLVGKTGITGAIGKALQPASLSESAAEVAQT
jgi:hypothetical protein